jgi:signal transduction histidine kinase
MPGLRCNAGPAGNPVELMMSGGIKTQAATDNPLRDLAHLAAAVGHQVINAFSAIVSNAELIRSPSSETPVPSGQDELADSIVQSALGASQVTRRLIDWTRQITAIETSTSGPDARAVDVNQLINELVAFLGVTPGTEVDWVGSTSPIPPIPGDALALRSMLASLIQNAREALPGGSGSIILSTAIDPRNWLVIEIRDAGCGMSAEILGRATEPFFSTKPGHAGIGLTIAQGIWRRHGGGLSIESRPGQGTTIRLVYGPLPAPAHLQSEPAAPTGIPAGSSTAGTAEASGP